MSLHSIGYSGVQAARIGMNVTALNLSNALTPGYSRQHIVQQAIGPMGNQRLFSGNGVEVSQIMRMADQFRIGQVWRGGTQVSYYDQTQTYLGGLETILGSDSTGIGDGLDNLFKSLNGATEKPNNQAMRQDVLTEARSLAMRFNNVQKFIQSQRSDIQQQQQGTVVSINTLTENIAKYNQKIVEITAAGGDTNILRDQRDELVKELSNYADVRVNINDKGEYNISLPSGQPLVNGKDFGTLSIQPDSNGMMKMTLSYAGSSYDTPMSCGGKLGALHDYASGTLSEMDESVKGMAQALATAFNAQLASGFDLNGNPGGALFIFDANDPGGMLQVTDLQWHELAFSSAAGESGNNQNLLELIKIKNQNYDIPGMGETSLDNASATLISTVGIKSRQNQTELQSAVALLEQAIIQRDNYSAVNDDEEYINLSTYTQSYQANMKVIATGDQIFRDLLALF
ncbi:flagellar hook-associated protein FlgK [Pantoea sp. B65]|uniref:flagellar hook-associated protein FlgK n=1 Tax=Pantoea sp. B65 TaxID=2813359 RepID=UPI0039B4295E